MPKRIKNKNDKTAQKKSSKSSNLISKGLIFVGKPFYLLIKNFITFVLIIKISPKKIDKKGVKTKIKNARKINIKPPKIKLPNFRKFIKPDFPKLIKIEWLRFNLLELGILQRINTKLRYKITRFQKLKLRKRIYITIIAVFIISGFFYFYFSILNGLPSPKNLSLKEPDVSTKIYDRNGYLLYKIYKDQNRTIVPLSKMPVNIRLATLAAEDAEFYSHPGFSIKGIFRSLVHDIKTGAVYGGSTITQQLVKNVLLSPEKTISRKIKEIILSVEVESSYTKDQILEMYLNEVGYGGTAYGIEEASQEYFGKNVSALDLSEAAFLAGLPKSPTYFSPFSGSYDAAITRQREVLRLMQINKFITPQQEEEAQKEQLVFVPNKTSIKAPHFVMYIRKLLVDKYGEDMVEKGGLEVTTSLDLPTQEIAENIVKTNIEKLKGLNVGNGAAMVTDPKTGEILAMVGSKDYFDANYDGQVNVTTSLRQPGSSIKVVNYAYALSHGFSPATIIDDSPITYKIPGTVPYSPVNYDGKFVGKISLRNALAESRNIPAVKVLASYGVPNMVDEGKQMGITTWNDSSNFGLSLTLGGGAVTMIDMTKVFSTLANGGMRPETLSILQVKDYKGRVLETNKPATTQELDSRVAFLLTDILKDNNARAPEFGLNSYLVVKNHPEVAVKTGTSNDLRDNWTIGYNQDYLVATWVGNNDNSPMSYVASGITGASPIWNEIISTLLNGKTAKDWIVPQGVVKISCKEKENTATKSDWFLTENANPNFCKSPTPKPTPIDTNKILQNGETVIYP